MPEALHGASSRIASNGRPSHQRAGSPRIGGPQRARCRREALQRLAARAAGAAGRCRARARRGRPARAGARSCRPARRRRRARARRAASAAPSSSGAARCAAASCTDTSPSAKPGSCVTGHGCVQHAPPAAPTTVRRDAVLGQALRRRPAASPRRALTRSVIGGCWLSASQHRLPLRRPVVPAARSIHHSGWLKRGHAGRAAPRRRSASRSRRKRRSTALTKPALGRRALARGRAPPGRPACARRTAARRPRGHSSASALSSSASTAGGGALRRQPRAHRLRARRASAARGRSAPARPAARRPGSAPARRSATGRRAPPAPRRRRGSSRRASGSGGAGCGRSPRAVYGLGPRPRVRRARTLRTIGAVAAASSAMPERPHRTPDLPQRGRSGAAAGLRAHPLPAGRRRLPLPRQRQHRRPSSRDGELDELKAEVAGQDAGGAARAGDRHRQRPQHQRHRQARGARCSSTEVFRGRYVRDADGHRVPERRAPERADDRRPDHGAQRLLAPPVPDPRARSGSACCRTSTRT